MEKAIFVLLIWLCFVQGALAVTRYVVPGTCTNGITTYNPTGGGGAGSCTGGSATVYSSINNAIAAGTTVAGDRLEVRAGTYSETMDYTSGFPSGTSFANAPIIIAYTGETVTISSTGATAAFHFSGGSSIDYVIIDGFKINANDSTLNGVKIQGGHNHIRVQNCEIYDARQNGILTTDGSGFNEFININAHDIGVVGYAPPDAAYGIYLGTANNLIEGGTIHDNLGYGIHLYEDFGGANNNTVRGVRVYNNGLTTSNYVAGIITAGPNNLVYNNFIYNNQRGIQVGYGGASNNAIYNNSVYGNSQEGLDIASNASGTTYRNNIFYNNSGGSISNSGSGSVFGTNWCQTAQTGCTYTGNPSFVDAPNGNLHLNAGSGAIGLGTDLYLSDIFTTDFDGNTRAVPWDIGADEYGTPPDSMTINFPAGGESLIVGSVYTILWSCLGCAGPIDIDLDRGNDTTFEEVIANDTTNDGSFDWTVTAGANANCKIRIRDGDASPTATSALFAIVASGGGGLSKRISDNTTGTYPGDITGAMQDVHLWSLAPTVNNGSDSFFYAVKSTASDYSHGLFRFDLSQIPAAATVTSVTLGLYLGHTIGAGSETINIRQSLRAVNELQATWNEYSTGNSWQTAGGTGAADRTSTISASLTGVEALGWYSVTQSSGQLKDDIQADVTAGTSHWYHMEDSTEGNTPTRGFVSREGTNGLRPYLLVEYTTSTSTITVIEPTAGEVFLSGQTGVARWTSGGISGNVRIDLSRDGGTTWETLVASTAFDSADVVVTYNHPTSSNCKLRVVSLNDTNIVGTSSGAFRIGGTRAGFLLNP